MFVINIVLNGIMELWLCVVIVNLCYVRDFKRGDRIYCNFGGESKDYREKVVFIFLNEDGRGFFELFRYMIKEIFKCRVL